MVLQRHKPIAIWGEAQSGITVSVQLDEKCVATVCGADGTWIVYLPSHEAGGPYELYVSAGEQQLCFSDVLIGEVWLAGGQSNMELELQETENGEEVATQSNEPNIRYYHVPIKSMVDQSLIEAEKQTEWCICNPETSKKMSAAAFYFSHAIAESEQVPIGIIECYLGGTSITCWMGMDALNENDVGKAYLIDYERRIGNQTQEEYERKAEEHTFLFNQWLNNTQARQKQNPNVTWIELYQEFGHAPWPPPLGRTSNYRPAGLFDAMVCRVCPYTLRGFLFYQGEEDSSRSTVYTCLMQMLIRQWRAIWKDETLPFLFVQLPMFNWTNDYRDGINNNHWAFLREAQSKVPELIPNVYMAVLTDCGELDNVHPVDKKTVGNRLALLSQKHVYGKSVFADAPTMEKTTIQDKTVTVQYRTEETLITTDGQPVMGFEIAGKDGVFCKADGEIQGNCVVLHSQVSEPVYIRYAWADYIKTNLHSQSGLAAASFRTDNFPINE